MLQEIAVEGGYYKGNFQMTAWGGMQFKWNSTSTVTVYLQLANNIIDPGNSHCISNITPK